MLDFRKIRHVLSDGEPRSFYRLAEELVGARSLSDFTWTALLSQELEKELPANGGFHIENGLVSLPRRSRLDECLPTRTPLSG